MGNLKSNKCKSLAVLIDMDGVLKLRGEVADDANQLIDFLRINKIPACILSNSTKMSPEMVIEFFESKGVNLEGIPVQTAINVARTYAQDHYSSARAYVVDEMKAYFKKLESDKPEVIIVGDLINGWSKAVLDEMFKFVMDGADLLAIQKNKYGKDEKGKMYIDAGAYVAAIEYASGVKAKLIGKPSSLYFEYALKKLGKEPSDGFVMIGDDLEVDIESAQKLGGIGVLAFTGKTDKSLLSASKVNPDYEVDDLAGFVEILKKMI
ncbi:HAD-IIA family hydrolase [Aureibacter tunicatorum]|uniref:HAD superfamily hydrolase (TIGR01458 family) n=1 Tax=Aureibacter tunicatorum TaxID=866807 RepID=A0AAE3XP57_9BACT|nr:HAD hydrolase-like protein [Aureibacter tunicatorum]MDR6238699.1 HAD superfamily hydrolase (TIGR01458 family) [Aureibacter tunicatorum]BDD05370.1 haloacid dehalogenase [Aureibacter tunicatorum]